MPLFPSALRHLRPILLTNGNKEHDLICEKVTWQPSYLDQDIYEISYVTIDGEEGRSWAHSVEMDESQDYNIARYCRAPAPCRIVGMTAHQQHMMSLLKPRS